MDIFEPNLQEIYFALMLAIAAIIIALFATWFSHRHDKQPGDKNNKRRRKKTFR
jgi:hypothetical protein